MPASIRDHATTTFIEAYVQTASQLFPNALLHWEDFGAGNARRILDRYRDQVCTFNDDMQGTAAVVLAAVAGRVCRPAGTRCASTASSCHGAGSAGLGIADLTCATPSIADGLSPAGGDRAVLACAAARPADRRPGPAARLPGPATRARAAEIARTGLTTPTTTASPSPRSVDRIHPTILIGTSGAGRRVHRADRRAPWPRTPTGRSSCRCPTRRRSGRGHPETCRPGPAAGR